MNLPAPPDRLARRLSAWATLAGVGLLFGLLVGAAHGVRLSIAEADDLMHSGGDGATVLILFGLPMFAIFLVVAIAVGSGVGLVAGLFVEAVATAFPARRVAVRVVLGGVVALLGALSFVFPQGMDRWLGVAPDASESSDVASYAPPPPPPVDAGPLTPSILAIARLDEGMLAIDRHGSRVVRVDVSPDAGAGAVQGIWWSASRARAVTFIRRDDESAAVVLLGAGGSAEAVLPALADALTDATCGWVEARAELVCLAPENDARPHAQLVTVPIDGQPIRHATWHRATPTELVAITPDGTGVLYVEECDDGYCVQRLDAAARHPPHTVATIERSPSSLALGPTGALAMATRSEEHPTSQGAVWYVEPSSPAVSVPAARLLVTMARYDMQPYSVRSLALTTDGAAILAVVVVGSPDCVRDCDPTLETIGPLDDPLYSSWTMRELDPSMLLVAIP